MSSVYMSADMTEPKLDRAWRADNGTIRAIVRFQDQSWPYLLFGAPAEARALAAACIAAAEAMDRLAAEGEEAGNGR